MFTARYGLVFKRKDSDSSLNSFTASDVHTKISTCAVNDSDRFYHTNFQFKNMLIIAVCKGQ